ncbi:hypothetical protein FAGAP_7968 [Fusarium agapanthi]|uniref:Uncharacterized protein n=1 Tax=Fusarium agapanthi TaxID=1803897 RepID=A0A9P5E5B9_9HYPO|nr:hypothetical protein FAGAP_7968 [Fusarium agapanthi]
MAKFVNKSASDFPMPTSKINSNCPLTRVPGISTPHLRRASGPQAPALSAMTGIRRPRLQALSAILYKSSSTKEACDIFTSELRVMAKNTGDVATILSQVIHHYKPDTPIHQHAQRESTTLCKGQWTAFFRKIAGNAQWLTNQWGGSLWLPADIRATAERLFGNSEPSLYVLMLVDITKAAQAKGMDLRSLWANNGELRVAMRKNASQYLTHQLVNGVIQSINGMRVENTLNAPKNGLQDRTAIDLVSRTEKANSDRVNTTSSNKTPPITQDPDNKAPIANMSHQGAQADTPPISRKRTSDQMNCEEPSSYSKNESLFLSLNPNDITLLRDLKGREDQIKQIRDQSKTLVDEISNGMKGQSDQGVLAGVLASTGTAYVNGITSLLDSVLQASSNSQDKPTAKELQARRAEAVDKASQAKERVQTLDNIEKARSIHQRYEEARSYRQKLRDLLSEADERAIELEKAYTATFSQAEQED